MLKLKAGEQLIKQDKVLRVLSALQAKPGLLYLTNQRVVFVQHHLLAQMLGLIGLWLANSGMLTGKVFEFPRQTIKSFAPGTHGFNKNVLEVQTQTATYKFVLTDTLAAWQSALQQ